MDRRIILKWILNKWKIRILIVLDWFGRESNGILL
jgi:hypothetical protein